MKKPSDVYEHLYHYTNLSGLKGILSSQSLWATHYKHLNDQSEMLLFGKEILPKYIEPAILREYAAHLFSSQQARENFFNNQGNLDQIANHDALVAVRALFKALDDQVFVSSFCGEVSDKNIQKHGQLSQWRGYGSKEGRFCIVFDTKKLEEMRTLEFDKFSYMGLGIGDMVYSDEEDRFNDELKDSIDAIVEYVPALTETFVSKKVRKKARPVPYAEFLSSICRYKHFGFKEEREVRLYAHIPKEKSKSDRRHAKLILEEKGKKIISLFSDLSENLPITRVIVGPHAQKKENIEMLSDMLSGTKIQLDISEIPFLD